MAKSTKKFKTEVQDLLNLVINALYSNKDIFLRELVSNASDAVDKLRFEALSKKKLLDNNYSAKIKLTADKDNKTLTISDNGIGMTKDELDQNIGTIARSGTKVFLENLKNSKKKLTPELIGQFGVGFYSAFMVSDSVTLITRKAGTKANEAVVWSSKGTGSYTIEEAEKETTGTDIILNLKEDALKYLEEWEIRSLIKKYSDYLEYPIAMDITREETPKDKEGKEIEGAEKEIVVTEEILNSQKAIWTRSKSEITNEEYNSFYQNISNDYSEPLRHIHYNAEGTLEFNAILYLPSKAPYDLFMNQPKGGIHLYVKRIFIMDEQNILLPEYLRFVKGVVDSSDLPLNVSREILQEDKILVKIQKALVKKVLDTLQEIKEKDYDNYAKFWVEFGKVIKEGVHSDFANKEKIAEICLFQSTQTQADKFTALEDYIKRMPTEQSEIYYITGTDYQTMASSPLLEGFRKKNWEVLLLSDPIDEWVVQSLSTYKEKPLKSIAKDGVKLDEEVEKKQEKSKDEIKVIEELLDENISKVVFSQRLTDSACCLVADENAMSANMEKIFVSMNQTTPSSKRILELNPNHKLIKHILGLAKKDAKSEDFKDYVTLLYEQALIAEGSPVKDPAGFNRRVSKFMMPK